METAIGIELNASMCRCKDAEKVLKMRVPESLKGPHDEQ